jgi:hypothetical protein
VIPRQRKTKPCNGPCRRSRVPLDGFHRNRLTKDGLQARCKVCANATAKRHYDENAEAIKAQRKADYHADPEAARQRERERYAADPERKKASHKRWKAKHPEKARANAQKGCKVRRQRMRAGGPDLTADEKVWVYWRCNGRCFYCNTRIEPESFQCDHWMPVSRGGSNGLLNRLPACRFCNNSKGGKHPDEFVTSRTWEDADDTVPAVWLIDFLFVRDPSGVRPLTRHASLEAAKAELEAER